MEHLDLRRRGPIGDVEAEWECLDCHKRGTLGELHTVHDCTGARKDQDTRLIDALEGKE